MIEISDLEDERLQDYRDLRDADLRGARRLFTVESRRVVRRFLASGWPVESVLIERSVADELQADLARLDEDVPVYVTEDGALRTVTGYGFHGGALALGRRSARPYDESFLEPLLQRDRVTLLAAEGVVHVDNMGGLFRNADCLGADGVLLAPNCADPLFRKTLRISSGRVFTMPWRFAEPWPDTLARLREEHGFRVIGLDTHRNAVSIDRMRAGARTVLLLGAEGSGLSEKAIEHCDQLCEIPVRRSDEDGEDASINVAVASGIALNERFRRVRGLGNDLD